MKQNQAQWTALKDAIDGEWIARQAQALVEIPSVTMQEAEVCQYYAAQEGCFRQGKARNYLDQEHIDKIVEAYRTFRDVDRFAHVADLEEIRDNDFNLNINRYVDTTEPVEVMSVDNALAQLREAERRREEAVAKMDELLAEMGYAR